MARNVTIKLNSPGVKALLRSPEMLADLEARARRIAAVAGPGFESDGQIGPSRARAAVWTDTFEAMHAEATTRALTRAIDAGR
jgi:hypothetical protein